MQESGTWLDRLERLGNRLPDPVTLFLLGALLVALLSLLGATQAWSLMRPGQDQQAITVNNLLDSDGLWWVLSHMVDNFISFPPLGIVLVGMLGIGLAERTGLLPVLLRRLSSRLPARWLTPFMLFIGIMSSLGLDAGYVILPPIAAALYLAAGRSPLVGIAVAFAGISAGFSANLLLTAVDPLLAGFTEAAARVLTPDYVIAVPANWWFMIASTVMLTFAGWMVTAWWVEPRFSGRVTGEPPEIHQAALPAHDRGERRGLWAAGAAFALTLAVIIIAVKAPGAALYGDGARFARWIEATVPLLMLCFLLPALVYGIVAGTVRSDRDVAKHLADTIASLGPYIVLAFAAAQFIAFFNYSRLGEILAILGGNLLLELGIPVTALMIGFVLVVMLGNLLIGSASAKYAFFAPVFVPMFMQVGISPELTQAAYRVGDSVTNVITPLNPYMVIIIAQIQRYARDAGLGTIVALMLPFALSFAVLWIGLLSAWIFLGLPLGPGGPLSVELP